MSRFAQMLLVLSVAAGSGLLVFGAVIMNDDTLERFIPATFLALGTAILLLGGLPLALSGIGLLRARKGALETLAIWVLAAMILISCSDCWAPLVLSAAVVATAMIHGWKPWRRDSNMDERRPEQPAIAEAMTVEDEVLKDLQDLERQIEYERAEKEHALAEKERERAEKERALAEQERLRERLRQARLEP